ncbi:MAG: menaquinone biosynthesis protein [Candidatus Poribacteria bacterium]|nr:menaquinone biosynthesis protein [Candidatus Poribacteria bacterium]
MVQKESRVKVGSVSYLNTKPLIHALLDNLPLPGSEEIELSLDVPSCLADDLKKGTLDVGLIPIIEYFRAGVSPHALRYRIIPHISISSRGAVQSIQLLSRVPIPAIRRVALDTSSRSSHALVKILLAEKYHVQPEFTPCSPSIEPQAVDADAVLLIGDAALNRLGSTDYALDLGAEWHALTGLPFVYACWVAREEVDLRNVPRTLLRAKEIGVTQIAQIAQNEAPKLGFSVDFCRDYLTKHIFFELGDSEIAGMMRYYELAVKYELVAPGATLKFVEGKAGN